MNILGLNGLGNIPAAALICKGQLIAFAEEERFTRIKGSDGIMPGLATLYCIKEAGLSINDIDAIAFGWDANKYLYKMPLFFLGKYLKNFNFQLGPSNAGAVLQQLVRYNPMNVRSEIKKMLIAQGLHGKTPEIYFVDHHLSHATSTFYCSGFEESLILVVDGSGEQNCTSLYYGSGEKIELIKSFKIPDSIGWFYQSMTEYLGFKPNSHEGKVMALASYGQKNDDLLKKLSNIIDFDTEGTYRHNATYSFTGQHVNGKVYSQELENLLGPARKPNSEISQFHKDIAFATQSITEEILLYIMQHTIQKLGKDVNLCIAGGVGLNCKMNGKLSQLKGIKNIFVPPHCHDAGTALGAAQWISTKKGNISKFKMTHAYWGPKFENDDILKQLINRKIVFEEHKNIASISANLLAQGKIIGWFQGRMEVGSRALGHRSILASPIDPTTKDHINLNIKSREIWRPFAASILDKFHSDYLSQHQFSPFMTLAYNATNTF